MRPLGSGLEVQSLTRAATLSNDFDERQLKSLPRSSGERKIRPRQRPSESQPSHARKKRRQRRPVKATDYRDWQAPTDGRPSETSRGARVYGEKAYQKVLQVKAPDICVPPAVRSESYKKDLLQDWRNFLDGSPVSTWVERVCCRAAFEVAERFRKLFGFQSLRAKAQDKYIEYVLKTHKSEVDWCELEKNLLRGCRKGLLWSPYLQKLGRSCLYRLPCTITSSEFLTEESVFDKTTNQFTDLGICEETQWEDPVEWLVQEVWAIAGHSIGQTPGISHEDSGPAVDLEDFKQDVQPSMPPNPADCDLNFSHDGTSHFLAASTQYSGTSYEDPTISNWLHEGNAQAKGMHSNLPAELINPDQMIPYMSYQRPHKSTANHDRPDQVANHLYSERIYPNQMTPFMSYSTGFEGVEGQCSLPSGPIYSGQTEPSMAYQRPIESREAALGQVESDQIPPYIHSQQIHPDPMALFMSYHSGFESVGGQVFPPT